MIKTLKLISLMVVMAMTFCCCSSKAAPVLETATNAEEGPAMMAYEVGGEANQMNPKVEMKIKDYGVIQLELDPNEAPITVENFLKLVNNGFYDGLTFHRIIKDFMIQGGDPLGTGRGGSDEQIKGEFSSNGVENNISHKRGVISMARSQFPDSASSQFFICHQDSEFLDGNYAAFGHVISGIEVVDKICDTVESSDEVPKEEQPVIEYIKELK